MSEGLRSPVRATRTNPTLPVAGSGVMATGPWAWAFICWTRLSPGAAGAVGAADAWVEWHRREAGAEECETTCLAEDLHLLSLPKTYSIRWPARWTT